MRTDQHGTEHPTIADEVTLQGWIHITGCGTCHQHFGPETVSWAEQMTALYEQSINDQNPST